MFVFSFYFFSCGDLVFGRKTQGNKEKGSREPFLQVKPKPSQ